MGTAVVMAKGTGVTFPSGKVMVAHPVTM